MCVLMIIMSQRADDVRLAKSIKLLQQRRDALEPPTHFLLCVLSDDNRMCAQPYSEMHTLTTLN